MLATIGYERADLSDFIATLRLAGVDVLVDIRDRAQSRRRGFSKTALSQSLEIAGIDYLHLRELGDPKEGREAARRGDFDSFRVIYGEIMKTEKAKSAMEKIKNLSEKKLVCLMCYERDEKTCHRKMVSDHIQEGLHCKTLHLGVSDGAGKLAARRRMHDSHQGVAPSVQPVF